ncbi:helix-turn-helix transcriptional regulator [Albidovulum sediminis]|uniref:Helix-turn-helix domain-containing protein n=1 Tax=Albidovulum sediminis TaxID=3066345 RepID=A0ABT2NIK9_9RHOB|nr:helix-turn-helix transcriptional regulator [Defluviimonas sediminis]MCT8327928.1 helix-turn-helix domain-containing protein [Defluviimonas sediminis]
MKSQFALDLRVARRNAGLTQRDCAILLSIQASRFSEIESGKCLPRLAEICALSLIFGRTFESLYGVLFDGARDALRKTILKLPADTRVYVGTKNRDHTIERLAVRLAEEQYRHDGV